MDGRCSLHCHSRADRGMEVDQQRNYSVVQSVSETPGIRWRNGPSGVAVYESRCTAKGVCYRLSHEMHDRVMRARMVVSCASSFGSLARNSSELCLPHWVDAACSLRADVGPHFPRLDLP